MKYMKCIHFEHSRCGVPKRVYVSYLPYDERKIDRTTPDRDQINLGPKPLPLLRPFSVMTSSQKLLVQTQASQAHVSTKSKLFIY